MTDAAAPAAIEHHHADAEGARLGMWLFLLSELFLFGGLFLIYSVYRFKNPADFHAGAAEMSRFLGTLNTVVLLTSSLTMALSIAAIQRANRSLSSWMLGFTIALSLVFLVNKYFEWTAHIGRGIYPNSHYLLSQPKGTILFFGLYYTMTGLHGVHVLVGALVLTVMLVLVRKGVVDSKNYVLLENSGLYWHLVDIIWIFLFPLFYLIT